MGASGYKVHIKRIRIFYKGDVGTISITYRDNEGDVEDTFDIDLSVSPEDSSTDDYRGVGDEKYFTYYTPAVFSNDASPVADFWQFDISEDSNNDAWHIQRLECMYTTVMSFYD